MYEEFLERVLFSEEQIENKVKEIASQITKEYAGNKPLQGAILKGSVMFISDLVRRIETDLEIDFMAISSYGSGSRSSGEVKMIKDLDKRIEGRDIIIVEDIVDSGFSMKYLKNLLSARNPASIKICTLLDKPSRRQTDVQADYKICYYKYN